MEEHWKFPELQKTRVGTLRVPAFTLKFLGCKDMKIFSKDSCSKNSSSITQLNQVGLQLHSPVLYGWEKFNRYL